jgi:hypothetical protein
VELDGPVNPFLTQVGTGRFTNLTKVPSIGFNHAVPSIGFSGHGSEVWWNGSLSRVSIMPLIGDEPPPRKLEHRVDRAAAEALKDRQC